MLEGVGDIVNSCETTGVAHSQLSVSSWATI